MFLFCVLSAYDAYEEKNSVLFTSPIILLVLNRIPEAKLEPCQTSMMKFFLETVNGFQPLSIFAKKLHQKYFSNF